MRNLQSFRLQFCLSLFALSVLPVVEAQPSIPNGSRLYSPCVACHLPTAWGSTDGSTPNLAGQNGHYLANRINLFRSEARVDAAMRVIPPHPTVEDSHDVVELVAYLSRLDWNPSPVNGSGEHLRLGQETYTHICAACHGADGRGQASNRVPRIAGQHYPYLRIQIDAAAALHRDLAPPEMTSALRGMGSPQKEALADYISRLGHAEALVEPTFYDQRYRMPR